jgi:hypothetical protein
MILAKYQNGNAVVELFDDGTRVITTPDSSLNLDYPLNIDIRCSTKCSFGFNSKTGKTFCGFCHESSRVDGKECNYESLMEKLDGLPEGIELAVGCNEFTADLYEFILWCSLHGYVVNLTVNQGHVKRDFEALRHVIECGFIKGLGISHRSCLIWDIPEEILNYSNTVFHVIAGIDSIEVVQSLKDKGVKKILVLGEKDFGFNKGKVDLETIWHKQWFWWVSKLFTEFDVVSFDNLALEQLQIKRFLTDEQWETFNQGEHSFYINAVGEYFAPSSRSKERTKWNNITIKDYYKTLNK